jgi:hypothetical protein
MLANASMGVEQERPPDPDSRKRILSEIAYLGRAIMRASRTLDSPCPADAAPILARACALAAKRLSALTMFAAFTL